MFFMTQFYRASLESRERVLPTETLVSPRKSPQKKLVSLWTVLVALYLTLCICALVPTYPIIIWYMHVYAHLLRCTPLTDMPTTPNWKRRTEEYKSKVVNNISCILLPKHLKLTNQYSSLVIILKIVINNYISYTTQIALHM